MSRGGWGSDRLRMRAHALGNPTPPPIGAGDRVRIGPAVAACVSYVKDGRIVPARDEELDGLEGIATVLAVLEGWARILGDDGSVYRVRLSRCERTGA